MKKYKLKRDLPTFKAGDEFAVSELYGGLWLIDGYDEHGDWYSRVCAYSEHTLKKFPGILKDWFEEIPGGPKTVWDLKIGDAYYIPDWDDQVGFDTWLYRSKDLMRRALGNCFLTKEDAEKELARRKAKQILLRDTNGFRPNKENEYSWYEIYYDPLHKVGFGVSKNFGLTGDAIPFATERDAEASIKAHENEWKTYLGVEDE